VGLSTAQQAEWIQQPQSGSHNRVCFETSSASCNVQRKCAGNNDSGMGKVQDAATRYIVSRYLNSNPTEYINVLKLL